MTVLPGAPALPKQIEDVTVPGQVLRGVGFRSADYTDTTGILPVTGAPAIEGSTPNTTFESSAFFPQRLITPNYFGTLSGTGRTSLILTPGQYRSDTGGALTDTQRAYSHMDMRLFYSGTDGQSFGANQPSLAAAPSIGNVQGTVSNGVVTFSATVTGDPSAGVQEVWVTWTGTGSDSGYGHWRSVDLSQDPTDSTHWTGTLPLPAGQSSSGMRFLDAGRERRRCGRPGHRRRRRLPRRPGRCRHRAAEPGHRDADGRLAVRSDGHGDRPERPGRRPDRRFTVSKERHASSSSTPTPRPPTAPSCCSCPPVEGLPSGQVTVQADLIGADGEPIDSQQVAGPAGDRHADPESRLRATALPALPFPALKATLTDGRGPLAGVPVTFTLPTGSPGGRLPGSKTTATVTTDAQRVAVAPQD